MAKPKKNKKVDLRSLKGMKAKSDYAKVGARSNNLQKGDLLAGGWQSKNDIPQKYWTEIPNPDYNPNEEGSQEFIHINEYEKDLDGGVPDSGSYEFNVDGHWHVLDYASFDLDELTKMAKGAINDTVKLIIDDYKETNNLRVCFDNVGDCVKNLTDNNYSHKTFCKDVVDYDIELNTFTQDLIDDIENQTVTEIPDYDELTAMFPAYTGV